jgi:hypothetical protein
MHRILVPASALLLLGALLYWGVYHLIGSCVDDDGILREPFALIPLGWLSLFASAATGIAGLIARLIAGRNPRRR